MIPSFVHAKGVLDVSISDGRFKSGSCILFLSFLLSCVCSWSRLTLSMVHASIRGDTQRAKLENHRARRRSRRLLRGVHAQCWQSCESQRSSVGTVFVEDVYSRWVREEVRDVFGAKLERWVFFVFAQLESFDTMVHASIRGNTQRAKLFKGLDASTRKRVEQKKRKRACSNGDRGEFWCWVLAWRESHFISPRRSPADRNILIKWCWFKVVLLSVLRPEEFWYTATTTTTTTLRVHGCIRIILADLNLPWGAKITGTPKYKGSQ